MKQKTGLRKLQEKRLAEVRRRGPQREFMGPTRRSAVTLAVTGAGSWKGRRGRMRIQITLSDQPTLEGERIEYAATIFRQRVSGRAGTVAEAIEQLATIYRERSASR